MVDKLRAWCAHAFLASVLVLLAVPGTVLAQSGTAQDGPGTEEGRLIVPLRGTATVQRAGNLTATPTRIDTGLIEIGDVESVSVTLRNDGAAGSAPVSIGEASLIGRDADEYTSDFAGYATLAPGESLEIGLTFAPRLPGVKTAGLRLDVEGTTAPYVVLLDGRSRWPLTSDLALAGEERLAFGQATVGKTVKRTFRLENVGDADAPAIGVSGIELGGDTPDAFDVAFQPATLRPGETLDVAVTMDSALAGTKSSALTIYHDGNNPSVELRLEGEVIEPAAAPVNFTRSNLKIAGGNVIKRGTSLQFGPDGKLYVSEMDGLIHVFAVTRKGKNDYAATLLETIDEILGVPNHDDDGTPNPALGKRLVTGFVVTGSAAQPVIYAVSSDPRQAAGPSGRDSDLDTNSGILHKLTRGGGGWTLQDVVRGLPRSEENHVGNGIATMGGGKVVVSMGGHTNQGVPSNNFAQLPEYALSGAVLEIDVAQIGGGTHDLPTLDDEDRPGANDANDPFGGNDGKNQAKLVADGPVKLFATGLRNAYDLTLTEAGRLYTFDNGPNTGWGNEPKAGCLNEYDDGGRTLPDNLHLLTRGSYAGHPNPTRGNLANTFNDSNPQSPVEIAAHPVECEYLAPGEDGSLTSLPSSTNGLDEYTASNFGGAMRGDLIAVSFNSVIQRFQLNGDGTAVTSKSPLASEIGDTPLDVIAQGDGGPFPGTIWALDWSQKFPERIVVLEPADY